MGDHTRQLQQVIARQREELGDNLEELVMKAKALTDWRAQVVAHPLGMLGLAVGGGVIVSTLISRRRRPPPGRTEVVARAPRRRSQASNLMHDIQSALAGVAIATAVDFMTDAVPGFQQHFRKHSEATGAD